MARIGGTGPTWGTTDQAYGIFESYDRTVEVDNNELARGDGETYSVEQTHKVNTYNFEYTYVTAEGPDQDDVGTGTKITLPEFGEVCYVQSITDRYSKGDFHKVSGTGHDWPYLGTLSS